MGLPAALRSRMRSNTENSDLSSPSTPTSKEHASDSSNASFKRATRMRRNFALSASFAYVVAWIFLVLVLIGNTRARPVLSQTYFFKLDLADIIPTSVPNARLINSIAQSIGLHDFYQVGLWNFCEGYIGEGITFCSPPQTLFWFNPVEVLTNELLSGATIALPTQVVTILSVLRLTSQIMFGFFLTAAVLAFLMIFLSPLAVASRWWSLPLAVASFLEMMLLIAASVVGTAISVAFKYAAEAQSELNIRAEVGVRMFVFMWLATGFSVWAFAVHSGMGCCCTSRRDLKIGRRIVRDGRGARF
ncbi:SUR7/PalI family-domain-containing protein [Corynascus novoguineensis]|uniref:SUR7/PalI family-domain-containing protein n=1 Tax=Corynascus novoguineensis TaxID=1126955 RepID=A0AAN7HBR0_9PEZI|nr:SUR7/PalI family-domain-containing protein [Corynascus novoguineensis]